MNSNAFQISRAVRVNTPAFIALSGPSGSGKTRSALELATGLAGPKGKILLADTEGNRALHYADLYQFDHVEWRPPYTPERNAELIGLAEDGGYSVLIVDSESDEWEGEGGLQEIKESSKDEFWARTKARHKHALINRMRRARVHICFCLRAEERVKISQVAGRPVVETLGWQPICEKRFLYEVQSSFLFDPGSPGVPRPIKLYDIHAQFFPKDKQISRAAGEALASWCAGGITPAPAHDPETGEVTDGVQNPIDIEILRDKARDVAYDGTDAFRAWWKTLSREERAALLPDIHTYQMAAEEADRLAAVREDPFGLPPATSSLAQIDSARPFDPRKLAAAPAGERDGGVAPEGVDELTGGPAPAGAGRYAIERASGGERPEQPASPPELPAAKDSGATEGSPESPGPSSSPNTPGRGAPFPGDVMRLTGNRQADLMMVHNRVRAIGSVVDLAAVQEANAATFANLAKPDREQIADWFSARAAELTMG